MDERAAQALAWARAQLQWPDARDQTIGSDASFRRYFRLTQSSSSATASASSKIVMDAPPEHESLAQFLDIGQRLAKAGLHGPAVHHFDLERGFAVLDDLGDQPWHQVLNDDNAEALFDQALDALIIMQRDTNTQGMARFDAPRLLAELNLFTDWFLAKHWRVELTDAEAEQWDLLCATLLRWAIDQPQCFCHRDFMPRNLMLSDPNPAIIDFQDALIGPISYDPICLFRDAFLSWPAERVDGWLETYRQRALSAGLPVPDSAELWRRSCDLMGAQRHLKVIGIFARIAYRDGKPSYLADVPRFFTYLSEASARNPELQPLSQLIADWRQRAQRLQ